MKSPLEFLKNGALALAIACILPFLVYQGIISLYPAPLIITQEHTSADNEKEINTSETDQTVKSYYCQFFIFELIASCCAIFLGLITSVDFLATGWIMGGILTVISGFLFNWRYLSSSILFLSLLLFLCIVVIGGYYTEHKKNKLHHFIFFLQV